MALALTLALGGKLSLQEAEPAQWLMSSHQNIKILDYMSLQSQVATESCDSVRRNGDWGCDWVFVGGSALVIILGVLLYVVRRMLGRGRKM